MLCYLDKTFCVSKNCKGECGRQLTDEILAGANKAGLPVSTAFFCEEAVNNEHSLTEWQIMKLKNIFAFLSILFGEDTHCSQALLNMSPDYIIEKYERYIESNRDEWPWGLHPNLRIGYFDLYFMKWFGKFDKDE